MASTRLQLHPKYLLFILALGLNTLVISLFFPSSIFSSITGIAFALVFIILLGYVLDLLRNRSRYGTRTGAMDNFALAFQYLRMNKKYILTSCIGLIISLLVISQTLIMMNSYQQYAFTQHTTGSDLSMISMSVDNVNSSYFHQWESFVNSELDQWVIQKQLPQVTASIYQALNPRIILAEGMGFYRYVDVQTVTTRNWDQETYQILSHLPSFPGFKYHSNDSVLLVPSSITRASQEFGYVTYDILNSVHQNPKGISFDLLIDTNQKPLDTTDSFNNASYTVNHVWKWTAQDISFIRENNINFPVNWFDGTIFETENKISEMRNFLNNATRDASQTPYIWGTEGFESKLYVSIPPIDVTPLSQLRSKIDKFYNFFLDISFNKISEMTPIHYPNSMTHAQIRYAISSPLQFVLDDYLENSNNFQSQMQFSITPLILISLFLFYFSLSIVESRKIRYFRKLKGRGLSVSQMTLSISGEMFSYSIIAPLIALPVAFPLATYLLSNVRAFQIGSSTVPAIVPYDLYSKIFLLALIFSIDFNLPLLFRIFSLHLNLNETKTPSKSLLEVGNYDFILLLFAFSYWIFVPYITVRQNIADLVYKRLGYVALGITLIASPVFVSRFLISNLDKLSHVFNRMDNVTVAIRSIQLNRKFTQKLITLLIISTMFTYIGLVASTSFVKVNSELTHYQLGSDMYVEGVDHAHSDDWDKLYTDGVKAISPVTRMTYRANGFELREGERQEHAVTYEFLGVDPSTLADVLYWKDNYANISLETILKQISTTPSIGLQELVAKGLGLSIGDEMPFLYGARSSYNYPLLVNTSFSFFPKLITSLPSTENITDGRIKLVQILTTNELLEDLAHTVSRIILHGALIKLKPGADRDAIRQQYFSEFVHLSYFRVQSDVHDRVSMFNANGSAGSISPLAVYEEHFFQASLVMLMVTSLIVTILGMAYYSFVTITQRKRELGIFRALGMVSNQLLRHLLIEIFLIVLTSVAFSAVVGTYISGYLFRIMSGNIVQTIPPFHIQIPYSSIIIYTGVMIGSAIVLTILPSYRLSRSQTGSILR